MSDDRSILLTNDDGIDSPGIRALYDALSTVASVTIVAPATDQSAVGRSLSHEVDVTERDCGYAVHGTPADCVVAGLAELAVEPDLVVAGCNEGANLGEYALGRSGTVSAAVEAAFFDVPAIATSLYIPATGDLSYREVDVTPNSFVEASRVTTFLAEYALDAGVFDKIAYLNVNVPFPDETPADVELTRPAKRYEMDAERVGDTIRLHDRVWERMTPEALPDPEGTDRRAVVDGRISISPLTGPHAVDADEALEGLLDRYRDRADAFTTG